MSHQCDIRWEKRWLNGRSHEEYRVLCRKCPYVDKTAFERDAIVMAMQHRERPLAWKRGFE